MTRKPKVGDVFQIPLSDSRMAYGQYMNLSKMGPIIRIFDLISKKDFSTKQIVACKLLFPPVITGLFAAIRDKMWIVVGNEPVSDFVQPRFVSTLYDQRTGNARIWFLWDGEKTTRIGSVLPSKYKELEFLIVWNPSNVVKRIKSGEMPFPYRDLIKHNRYTPRTKTP